METLSIDEVVKRTVLVKGELSNNLQSNKKESIFSLREIIFCVIIAGIIFAAFFIF